MTAIELAYLALPYAPWMLLAAIVLGLAALACLMPEREAGRDEQRR